MGMNDNRAPRTAPYSIEAEQAVLGGMLLDNRVIHDARAILEEADFYRADHQIIWRGICVMIDRRMPVDFVTLSEWLKREGTLADAGGLAYVGSLAHETPSAANVEQYARHVKERSVMRRLISVGGDIAELGYRPHTEDVAELVSQAQRAVMDIAAEDRGNEPVLMANEVEGWHAEFLRRQQCDRAPGLQTRLRALDEKIVGMEPGDLMVIAGATGMGKTVAGLTITDNVLLDGHAVLCFSLEMPKYQLMSRQISARADVPLRYLRDPRGVGGDVMHDDAIVTELGKMKQSKFYVNDKAGISMQQMRSQAMRLKAKVDYKLMLVDYFQLIGGQRRNNDSRTNELDNVSRDMKALAKDLGVPVILLAQVSDEPNKRDNKRPRFNEIRECKALPNDADILLLLYRDAYFNKGSPHKGIMEIEIAKQRNGGLGTIEVAFEGGMCRVKDYDGPSFKERMGAHEADHPKPKKNSKKAEGQSLVAELKKQ